MKKKAISLPVLPALAGVLALASVSPAITAETVQSAQSPSVEIYSYDSAGRLLQVSYGNGPAISYSYDANGNIVSVEVVAGDEMFKDGFEQ